MSSFIVGSLKQAKIPRGATWEMGDEFSALEYHTIFFGDVVPQTCPNVCFEQRNLFRKIGSLMVVVSGVGCLVGNTRLALLTFEDDDSRSRLDQLAKLLDVEMGGDMLMTLPGGSGVEEGMSFSIGYMSLLEPSGDAKYRIMSDVPISSGGTRFEIVDHKENEQE